MAIDVDGWHLYDADQDIEATHAAFLVGPVVGRVTVTSARILVESAQPDSLHFDVRRLPLDTGHLGITNFLNAARVTEKRASIAQATPLVVEIDGLEPGSAYAVAVTLTSRDETRVARLRTPVDKDDWRFAVVSCNSHKHNYNTGHWERLATVATRLDAIFHVGDQVYADEDTRRAVTGDADAADCRGKLPPEKQSAWVKSCGYLENVPREEWPAKRPAILEAYRNVYRRTWNYPATAAVLAGCANYMIDDDHEITDDVGDLPQHSDPESQAYFVACCGYRVYREYQAQLFQDLDPTALEPAYYAFKISPRIGVFMTDNRIERSVRKPLQLNQDWEDKQFLGPSQWAAIEGALNGSGGALAGVEVLIFVTPTPLIFLSHATTGLATKIIDDAFGTWGHEQFGTEQHRLLTLLSEWQGARAERGVCILGGDIHVGGFSSAVLRREGSVINQITSSAICNEPETQLGPVAASCARGVMRIDTFMQDFEVVHRDWVMDPNWALLFTQLVGDGGPPHMTATLFHTKGRPRLRNFNFGEPLHKSAKAQAAHDGETKSEAASPGTTAARAPPAEPRREHPLPRDPHANAAAAEAWKTAEELGYHVPIRGKSGCSCVVS